MHMYSCLFIFTSLQLEKTVPLVRINLFKSIATDCHFSWNVLNDKLFCINRWKDKFMTQSEKVIFKFPPNICVTYVVIFRSLVVYFISLIRIYSAISCLCLRAKFHQNRQFKVQYVPLLISLNYVNYKYFKKVKNIIKK